MRYERVKIVLRVLFCFAFVLLLSSCRATEYMNENPAKFLWFIPVSAELTIGACLFEFAALILAWLSKSTGTVEKYRAGKHSREIRRGIYNDRGERIGSYGTGEYEHWEVSQEESDRMREYYKRDSLVIRVRACVILTWGVVISWIFPFPGFWFWLFFLPICGYRLYYWHKHMDSIDVIMIWEKIVIAICIICIIVYSFRLS